MNGTGKGSLRPALRGATVAALLGIVLAGCGGAPAIVPGPPKARAVELQVRAAADLNPNRDSRPSPVVVRIFVLRDSAPFLGARFDALTRDAATALGGSLLLQERRILRPGESTTMTLRVDPEAGYLGVMAEYADLEGAEWRAVMSAPEKRLLDLVSKKPLVLEVGRDRVRLATVD